MITIRDIRTIVTAPRGTELVVVKVETSEPGLYGVGCATFTQRWSAVVTAVNDFLKPLLVGKPVNQINDLWQYMMSFSYWRNGPVLNNAISGCGISRERWRECPYMNCLAESAGKASPRIDMRTGETLKKSSSASKAIWIRAIVIFAFTATRMAEIWGS